MTARILLKEDTASATPASGYIAVYTKTDGILYYKDDAGTEHALPGQATLISDTAYAGSWNGVTTVAPSKNAVYDKIETVVASVTAAVSDTAYAGSWDSVTTVAPSKNAVYDRLEAMKPESLIIACSDETTAITTGTAKVTFRMPYAFTLTAVRASVTTAPTGSTIIIDINETGSGTILSTKLTIDASEKTSTTAATPAVISDTSLADDAEITIDFDQVGSTIAGAGVKVTLIGYKT